ncbi:acyl carrier protein [Kitasatospora sp. NPDC051170]|uniref:acyl carrier protein n=1 Tax=Kitasatospora sp. NPDC051170 TaxID=3364056 RepID=UPI00379C818F
MAADGRSELGAQPQGGVGQQVLEFLLARTKTAWKADQDLFASGTVSSLFAMELVVFLEKEFGVTIGGADLRLDNFRTVNGMVALVARLREEKAGARGE